MRRSARPAHFLAAVVAVIGLGSGCGKVSIPVTLALEQPSNLNLEFLKNTASTTLIGGVDTTIVANLGLLNLLGALAGQAVPADVSVDNVLIAGTNIVLVPDLFETGTICVFQDPNLESGGTASFNLLLGTAAFNMTLNMSIALTSDTVSGLITGPQPFSQAISAVVPLSLSDLLGILGGSGGSLSITQSIDTTLTVPVIKTIHVTGTLTLASTDEFPTDDLLTECADYIAGL